jgi:hypothetical protein
MNLVLFGYFAVGNNFEELTDVNLKEMMFEQRMKEIENDLVPFGFINDGQDDESNILEEDMGVWTVDKNVKVNMGF